jgi:hypothetical protein
MTEERKRTNPAIIYILLMQGMRPGKLIELGFSRTTVYACNRKMDAIREQLERLLRKPE